MPTLYEILSVRARRLTPRWTGLAAIGRSRIITSAAIWMFITPVAAELLRKVNSQFPVHVFGHDFNLNLKLPFSWQVLFWASLSATIANLILWAKCPAAIRDFQNYIDFRDKTGSPSSLLKELLSDVLIAAGYEFSFNLRAASEIADNFVEKDTGYGEDPPSFPPEEHGWNNMIVRLGLTTLTPRRGRGKEIFTFIRGVSDRLYPWARCSCAAFYAVAFVLISILVIQNAWTVFSYAAK